MTEDKTVLAIDPGSRKCGLALVSRHGEDTVKLIWRKIVPPDAIPEALAESQAILPYTLIVVGSGTQGRQIVEAIREAMPSISILVVDEKDTTYQARERYWEHNPRRGWRRILPSTLQVPPEPLDDFVALILAERVLRA
jgi:RNase H-fold protein (predicted Holliday junction resolvase)